MNGFPLSSLRKGGILSSPAFSLVEVVLALGVVSFAVLSIISLLPAGIQSTKDSLEETGAINVLSGIVADRQATPFTTRSAHYQIPVLTSTMTVSSNSFTVTDDYQLTTDSSKARYRVDYRVTPPTSGTLNAYQTWFKVSWPAAAVNPSGYVESLVTFTQP